MDNVAYLLTCSDISREAFVLAKLDRASQLRKEIVRLLNEWVECESYATLGDIIREAKRTTVAVAIESQCQIPSLHEILSAARRQLKQSP